MAHDACVRAYLSGEWCCDACTELLDAWFAAKASGPRIAPYVNFGA